LGPELDEESKAEAIARQWLTRYGIVTRDWWRRERPPVSWRAIYRELRRLEMRGEVRRGYFVRGLGGAQFALPDAVEQLRSVGGDPGGVVVMATSDPANPYSLALEGVARDPLSRPRGAGALLVTRAGNVIIAAEARGQRLVVASDLDDSVVSQAAAALATHLMSRGRVERRQRDLKIITIDGRPAGVSEYVNAFTSAGFLRSGMTLRYLAPV
jgi:ATP-dependent Lhr-like helicase